jgi:hypothetical protein
MRITIHSVQLNFASEHLVLIVLLVWAVAPKLKHLLKLKR